MGKFPKHHGVLPNTNQNLLIHNSIQGSTKSQIQERVKDQGQTSSEVHQCFQDSNVLL